MSGLMARLPSLAAGGFLKYIALGAGLLMIALLIASHLQTVDLRHQRDSLNQSINDPQTGYVVRLAQAHTNTAQLETAIQHQTIVMRQVAADSARALASTRQALNAANARADSLEHRAHSVSATPPAGGSLEAQITDIDNRVLADIRANRHE